MVAEDGDDRRCDPHRGPPSTKNATKTRDPEMHQTRNGQPWHVGMKVPVGTDLRGRGHHVTATNAHTAELTPLPALLTGQERDRYGDKAYWKADDGTPWALAGGRSRVTKRGTTGAALTDHERWIHRCRSRRRARGEHACLVVQRLWGLTMVRYRGLAKNLTRDGWSSVSRRSGSNPLLPFKRLVGEGLRIGVPPGNPASRSPNARTNASSVVVTAAKESAHRASCSQVDGPVLSLFCRRQSPRGSPKLTGSPPAYP